MFTVLVGYRDDVGNKQVLRYSLGDLVEVKSELDFIFTSGIVSPFSVQADQITYVTIDVGRE